MKKVLFDMKGEEIKMQAQPYEAPKIISVTIWTSSVFAELTESYGGAIPTPDNGDTYPY